MILLKLFGKFQLVFPQFYFSSAMYKTWNTGTGNGMRGTRGIEGMLYSGKYRETLRGMSSNILAIVAKNSGECRQTFRGILLKIPRNAHKD